MTGRALVIRTIGDKEIAGAIVDALTPKQPTAEQLRVVQEELRAAKLDAAAMGVRTVRDRDYFHTKVREAEYYYGDNPTHGKPAQIALGIIGLVCEMTARCYRYLSAWNRS